LLLLVHGTLGLFGPRVQLTIILFNSNLSTTGVSLAVFGQKKLTMYIIYLCSKIRLVNGLLEGIHFVASIEAMYLGVRAGIHPSIIFDIISNAAGSSRLWKLLDHLYLM
jgi:hypothetical protein